MIWTRTLDRAATCNVPSELLVSVKQTKGDVIKSVEKPQA